MLKVLAILVLVGSLTPQQPPENPKEALVILRMSDHDRIVWTINDADTEALRKKLFALTPMESRIIPDPPFSYGGFEITWRDNNGLIEGVRVFRGIAHTHPFSPGPGDEFDRAEFERRKKLHAEGKVKTNLYFVDSDRELEKWLVEKSKEHTSPERYNLAIEAFEADTKRVFPKPKQW